MKCGSLFGRSFFFIRKVLTGRVTNAMVILRAVRQSGKGPRPKHKHTDRWFQKAQKSVDVPQIQYIGMKVPDRQWIAGEHRCAVDFHLSSCQSRSEDALRRM